MIINKNVYNKICTDVEKNKLTRAKRYIKDGRVNIIKSNYLNQDNFSITATVYGNINQYEVNIVSTKGELSKAYCECTEFKNSNCTRQHIIATLLKFEQTKYWDNTHEEKTNLDNKKNSNFKYKIFNNLINSFYNEELNIPDTNYLTEKVKIDTKIDYDKFSNRFKIKF